jgi:hypothetical protein
MKNTINFMKQHIIGFSKFTYSLVPIAIYATIVVAAMLGPVIAGFMILFNLYPFIGSWVYSLGVFFMMIYLYSYSEIFDAIDRRNNVKREAQRKIEVAEYMKQREIEREQLREEIIEELMAKRAAT